jgi:PAS domain S-box-containing protein
MNNLKLTEKALVEEVSKIREKLTELEKQLTVPGQELEGAVPMQRNEPFMWQVDMGFCEYDLESRHTFFSASFLEMTGYSSDGIADIYTFLQHLVHPADQRKVKKLWKKCISSKERFSSLAFRVQRMDKSFIWVTAGLHPLVDEGGNYRKIILSINNIDKLKKEYEGLLDIESQYRNLFESNLYGIVRGDLVSDLILDFNKKAADILGTPPMKSFQDFAHFLFKDRKDDLFTELMDKRKIPLTECKIQMVDESVRWLQVSAQMINEATIAEIYFNDITDSKTSILELQKINFELDNFVYHSSHDLKSPLKSILGLINILRMEKDSVSQQECIDMIEGSIIRLDKLVNDLLSLSRNNRIDDNLLPINFMVELNNTITNFYHTSDTKKLEIIPMVYQSVPFVADLTRIRIVLNNLISNAFKYRSFDKSCSYVKIEIRVDKDKAILIVEDNGIGIAQSKQEKVFDMFYRASEFSDGSGLGLYIVKNVVDKINGSISIESTEGIGFTFTV